MPKTIPKKIRRLVLVLGDQLDDQSNLFEDFDPKQDLVWMAEVAEESEHVWSHKVRIVMFLSAMRHFRDRLAKSKIPIDYRQLDDDKNLGTLAKELSAAIDRHSPEHVRLMRPGDHRVYADLKGVVESTNLTLDLVEDDHFFATPADFAEHAKGRKQLRQEFYYRELRKKHSILMDDGDPVGGQWNFDKENRGKFGKKGPQDLPEPATFKPDKITKQVIKLVEEQFANHPGDLSTFDWPVTPEDAEAALDDFITHRLHDFGKYQDAMWQQEPWLYHSRLSAAMNLKFLSARKVVERAADAYYAGDAPLNSVEGFVRQILGWREYVRGVYWHFMPDYLDRNKLQAREPLPDFYWTGKTDMKCLEQALGQTLKYGYAHHIQRLMVTGLFTLLLGVDPKQVHEWYLAVYIDAVEWVELPNTLGMSQYGDGGVMGSKPYAATGKYIQRMSNYCSGCRFDPAQATGDDACPFTTLYWDFLARHQESLASNNRMSLQLKNVERKDPKELEAIRKQAKALKKTLAPA